MISGSEPLWPYLFLAAGWSAACAYLMLRSRRANAGAARRHQPVERDSELATSGQTTWERDTQAGRM
jgi:hypothetical protein